jgi:hypothetical protein
MMTMTMIADYECYEAREGDHVERIHVTLTLPHSSLCLVMYLGQFQQYHWTS